MLSIQDMHKTFGDVVALDGCTFGVERGTMLGFLGPNGAGKTTAMRSIFGLMRPDSGHSHLGRASRSASTQRQTFRLHAGAARPLSEDEDSRPADLPGPSARDGQPRPPTARPITGWSDSGSPIAVTTRSKLFLTATSSGCRLAAALIHDPELLVLDEPFSGLDPIASETMSDILREQAAVGKGRCLLLTSARPGRGPLRGSRDHQQGSDRGRGHGP